MHDKPGRLCTSWTRDGYSFDGCIEWLLCSHPGPDLHRIWQELGAVQGRRFINYDVFQRIEGSDGRDRAEAVISAADGHATIFDMLEGRYAGDKVRAAEPKGCIGVIGYSGVLRLLRLLAIEGGTP